jgi:hypothetical protein
MQLNFLSGTGSASASDGDASISNSTDGSDLSDEGKGWVWATS